MCKVQGLAYRVRDWLQELAGAVNRATWISLLYANICSKRCKHLLSAGGSSLARTLCERRRTRLERAWQPSGACFACAVLMASAPAVAMRIFRDTGSSSKRKDHNDDPVA